MGNATPGPWEWVSFNDGYSALWNPETREEVLVTGGLNDGDEPITWMGEELTDENKARIAAAPETAAERDALLAVNAVMLEVLKDNIKTCPKCDGEGVRYAMLLAVAVFECKHCAPARAAVAKATGNPDLIFKDARDDQAEDNS